jgi:23S rRNA (guanosine2251-2'-O)-methyltransferase
MSTSLWRVLMRKGFFMSVLYGINAAMEALKSDSGGIEKICLQRGQKNPRIREIIEISRQKHIHVSHEEKAWLDRKAGGQRHQGVLCYLEEMAAVDVEQILESASSPGLLVVLDGVEDPHNLGAILRSAEVSGAGGVLLPQRRSAGLNATVMKASAGAASHIKVARITNIAQQIELLKKRGYWIIGLAAESGRPIWEADFSAPTVLVLGNEGEGLHRLVKEKCDFLVSIPVRGNVSSHNVSVAAGIALYEALRQRSRSAGSP